VNWEDPIYDQFQDFGDDSIEDEEAGTGGVEADIDDSDVAATVSNNQKAARQLPPSGQVISQSSGVSTSSGGVSIFSIGASSSSGGANYSSGGYNSSSGGASSSSGGGRYSKSEQATKCDSKRCQLPECRCGGTAVPGGLMRNSTPQLVMLTFDGAVNDLSRRSVMEQ
jgi:hypothetical protein